MSNSILKNIARLDKYENLCLHHYYFKVADILLTLFRAISVSQILDFKQFLLYDKRNIVIIDCKGLRITILKLIKIMINFYKE